MTDDFFDFGFTVVDENELEAVQKATQTAETASTSAEEMQAKIDDLYNAVQPLLNNLKKNPEKEYIYWPNRIEKVEAFEEHLLNIYGR
jgi:gas vesicle protein